MSDLQPYVIEVVQGATLFREIAILDSDREPVDVSSTIKTIQISPGILESDFSITQGSSDHVINIRADGDETVDWPVGNFKFRVWLDWGVGAGLGVEDEAIFSGVIVVRAAL